MMATDGAGWLPTQPPVPDHQGPDMAKPPERRFTRTDPREAAEAAFRAVKAKPPLPDERPASAVPNARELVSLRIDRDVLDFFQEEGPGWQDRINAALRTAAGK